MHFKNSSGEGAKEAIALPQTPPTAIAPEGNILRNGTASAGRRSTYLYLSDSRRIKRVTSDEVIEATDEWQCDRTLGFN